MTNEPKSFVDAVAAGTCALGGALASMESTLSSLASIVSMIGGAFAIAWYIYRFFKDRK